MKLGVAAGALMVLGSLLSAPAFAQLPAPPSSAAPADDGQWAMPAKNYASTRYTDLNEINADNVKNLKVTFTFSTGVERGHAAIVADVAAGKIDTAVLWGPLAGYFALKQAVPMKVMLAAPAPTDLPMVFDIAMATRTDDTALHDAVDQALAEHQPEVGSILDSYGIPRMPHPAGGISVRP